MKPAEEEAEEIADCINNKIERAKVEAAYVESLRKIPNPITSDEE